MVVSGQGNPSLEVLQGDKWVSSNISPLPTDTWASCMTYRSLDTLFIIAGVQSEFEKYIKRLLIVKLFEILQRQCLRSQKYLLHFAKINQLATRTKFKSGLKRLPIIFFLIYRSNSSIIFSKDLATVVAG